MKWKDLRRAIKRFGVLHAMMLLTMVSLAYSIGESNGTLDPWPTVIGGVIALIVLATFVYRTARWEVEDEPEYPVDQQLQRALAVVQLAMDNATRALEEFQRETAARRAALDVLIAQAEENRALAEIHEVDARKIDAILFKRSRGEAARQKRSQLVYFFGGLLASIPIGVVINLLTN